VGVARIELATPAMSTQCSTTELHAHAGCHVARGQTGCKRLRADTPLQPSVLILGLEKPVDLGDEVAQVEGLGKDLGRGRGLAGLQTRCRIAHIHPTV
jgi:hypothetical protein